MKVFIIAAASVDGFIARNERELINWTSKEDKQLFREKTKAAGVVIVGGNTYRTFSSPLPGRKNIVYTRRRIANPDVETTSETPNVLISRLKSAGAKEVAVIGGSSIYTMFLKAGAVTDIYLTIEPLLFGSGIKLINAELNLKLTLKTVSKLNRNTLFVHYTVAGGS